MSTSPARLPCCWRGTLAEHCGGISLTSLHCLHCTACRGTLARWKVWFLLRLADYELQEENQAGVVPRLQQAVAAAVDSGPEDQVSFR